MLDPKLESLIAVQESGSFTRAAEALSLTQPAISQHVKQLEKELGVRLFFRSEGQLKPTEEGKIVLKYARRMMTLDSRMVVAILGQNFRHGPVFCSGGQADGKHHK